MHTDPDSQLEVSILTTASNGDQYSASILSGPLCTKPSSSTFTILINSIAPSLNVTRILLLTLSRRADMTASEVTALTLRFPEGSTRHSLPVGSDQGSRPD